MTAAPLTFLIHPDAGSDLEELAELGHRLRTDLLDAGADPADARPAGPAPAGTKGAELLALGSVLVAVGRSVPLLGRVLATVRDWIGQQPVRSVTVSLDGDTIELTHASSEEQRRLIDAWISRHAEVGG